MARVLQWPVGSVPTKAADPQDSSELNLENNLSYYIKNIPMTVEH